MGREARRTRQKRTSQVPCLRLDRCFLLLRRRLKLCAVRRQLAHPRGGVR